MKTFTIWIIDKIRYIAGILFFLVIATNTDTNEILPLIAFVLGVIAVSPLPLASGILMYLIPGACSIYLNLYFMPASHAVFCEIAAEAIGLICAIFTGIFLYRNFDIVISRRFRYHNSRLSEWQLQWLYSIKNAANVYILIISIYFSILYL